MTVNIVALQRHISSWRAELAQADERCHCALSRTRLPRSRSKCGLLHCLVIKTVTVRVSMNLCRIPNEHLADADVPSVVEQLDDLLTGYPDGRIPETAYLDVAQRIQDIVAVPARRRTLTERA